MRADITSMMGLPVYTQKGIFAGKVDDAVLDPEKGVISGLALGSINREIFDIKGRGAIIPYSSIMAVGDIVIMKSPIRDALGKSASSRNALGRNNPG